MDIQKTMDRQKNLGKNNAHHTWFKVIVQIIVMKLAWCQKKLDWQIPRVEDSDGNSCTHAARDTVILTKMHIGEKIDFSTYGVQKIVIPHIKDSNQITNCHP